MWTLGIFNRNKYTPKLSTIINSYDDYYFKKERAEKTLKTHFNVPSLESFGIESDQINQEKQVSVSGALLNYLLETQKNSLSHFKITFLLGILQANFFYYLQ